MNIDYIEWSHYIVVACIFLVLAVLCGITYWACQRERCPWHTECQRLREGGLTEYEIEQEVSGRGGIYYEPEIEE